LGTTGQSVVGKSAQAEATVDEAAPYVVALNIGVEAEVVASNLLEIITAELLPQLRGKEGYSDSLSFYSQRGELVIISIFGSKQGAEEAFALAGEWRPKDDSGLFSEYDVIRSFGEGFRFYDPNRGDNGAPDEDCPPWFCSEYQPPRGWNEYPAIPEFIGRAAEFELIEE
jgi:hypothetical protein